MRGPEVSNRQSDVAIELEIKAVTCQSQKVPQEQ